MSQGKQKSEFTVNTTTAATTNIKFHALNIWILLTIIAMHAHTYAYTHDTHVFMNVRVYMYV